MSTPPPAGGGSGLAPAAAALPPTPATGLHGSVAAFASEQEEWGEYIERLEHYFTANDIVAGDKQRAILLNAVGASTYRLIRTLVSPAKVTDVSFADIVEKARAHFNPKPSPIVKRYEFNTRRQGETESIATYVAELRTLAEYCDYRPVLSDMLRDRLVCGLQKPSIQRRLLQEPALTFEKASEMSLAAEAADKDSKRLTITPLDKNLSTSLDKDLSTSIGKVLDRPIACEQKWPWQATAEKLQISDHLPEHLSDHLQLRVLQMWRNTSLHSVPTKNMSAITARRRGTWPAGVARGVEGEHTTSRERRENLARRSRSIPCSKSPLVRLDPFTQRLQSMGVHCRWR